MLEPLDFYTATWKRLEAHVQRELADAMHRLTMRQHPDPIIDGQLTASLRERVLVLKELLALKSAVQMDDPAEPAERSTGPRGTQPQPEAMKWT